jgi:cobalamin synthase
MAEPKPKKRDIFSKIETREEALKTIKDTTIGFYFIAILHIVLGYFVGLPVMIDGVLYAVLGFLLQKFNSRIVAVLLLIVSGIALITTVINRFGGGTGGRNILLAIIVLWASIRAVQATFKLQSLPVEQEF